MTDTELEQLYGEAGAKRLVVAGFRVAAVLGIGLFITLIAFFAGGAFGCLAAFVSGAVAVAFALELVKNLRPRLLFVVGQVTESGWALAADGGGAGEVGARLVAEPRMSLAVEEAFFKGTAGPREVATVENPFVVLHPKWMSRLKKGERVVLVCLPASTDPVHFRSLPPRV